MLSAEVGELGRRVRGERQSTRQCGHEGAPFCLENIPSICKMTGKGPIGAPVVQGAVAAISRTSCLARSQVAKVNGIGRCGHEVYTPLNVLEPLGGIQEDKIAYPSLRFPNRRSSPLTESRESKFSVKVARGSCLICVKRASGNYSPGFVKIEPSLHASLAKPSLLYFPGSSKHCRGSPGSRNVLDSRKPQRRWIVEHVHQGVTKNDRRKTPKSCFSHVYQFAVLCEHQEHIAKRGVIKSRRESQEMLWYLRSNNSPSS